MSLFQGETSPAAKRSASLIWIYGVTCLQSETGWMDEYSIWLLASNGGFISASVKVESAIFHAVDVQMMFG